MIYSTSLFQGQSLVAVALLVSSGVLIALLIGAIRMRSSFTGTVNEMVTNVVSKFALPTEGSSVSADVSGGSSGGGSTSAVTQAATRNGVTNAILGTNTASNVAAAGATGATGVSAAVDVATNSLGLAGGTSMAQRTSGDDHALMNDYGEASVLQDGRPGSDGASDAVATGRLDSSGTAISSERSAYAVGSMLMGAESLSSAEQSGIGEMNGVSGQGSAVSARSSDGAGELGGTGVPEDGAAGRAGTSHVSANVSSEQSGAGEAGENAQGDNDTESNQNNSSLRERDRRSGRADGVSVSQRSASGANGRDGSGSSANASGVGSKTRNVRAAADATMAGKSSADSLNKGQGADGKAVAEANLSGTAQGVRGVRPGQSPKQGVPGQGGSAGKTAVDATARNAAGGKPVSAGSSKQSDTQRDKSSESVQGNVRVVRAGASGQSAGVNGKAPAQADGKRVAAGDAVRAGQQAGKAADAVALGVAGKAGEAGASNGVRGVKASSDGMRPGMAGSNGRVESGSSSYGANGLKPGQTYRQGAEGTGADVTATAKADGMRSVQASPAGQAGPKGAQTAGVGKDGIGQAGRQGDAVSGDVRNVRGGTAPVEVGVGIDGTAGRDGNAKTGQPASGVSGQAGKSDNELYRQGGEKSDSAHTVQGAATPIGVAVGTAGQGEHSGLSDGRQNAVASNRDEHSAYREGAGVSGSSEKTSDVHGVQASPAGVGVNGQAGAAGAAGRADASAVGRSDKSSDKSSTQSDASYRQSAGSGANGAAGADGGKPVQGAATPAPGTDRNNVAYGETGKAGSNFGTSAQSSVQGVKGSSVESSYRQGAGKDFVGGQAGSRDGANGNTGKDGMKSVQGAGAAVPGNQQEQHSHGETAKTDARFGTTMSGAGQSGSVKAGDSAYRQGSAERDNRSDVRRSDATKDGAKVSANAGQDGRSEKVGQTEGMRNVAPSVSKDASGSVPDAGKVSGMRPGETVQRSSGSYGQGSEYRAGATGQATVVAGVVPGGSREKQSGNTSEKSTRDGSRETSEKSASTAGSDTSRNVRGETTVKHNGVDGAGSVGAVSGRDGRDGGSGGQFGNANGQYRQGADGGHANANVFVAAGAGQKADKSDKKSEQSDAQKSGQNSGKLSDSRQRSVSVDGNSAKREQSGSEFVQGTHLDDSNVSSRFEHAQSDEGSYRAGYAEYMGRTGNGQTSGQSDVGAPSVAPQKAVETDGSAHGQKPDGHMSERRDGSMKTGSVNEQRDGSYRQSSDVSAKRVSAVESNDQHGQHGQQGGSDVSVSSNRQVHEADASGKQSSGVQGQQNAGYQQAVLKGQPTGTGGAQVNVHGVPQPGSQVSGERSSHRSNETGKQLGVSQGASGRDGRNANGVQSHHNDQERANAQRQAAVAVGVNGGLDGHSEGREGFAHSEHGATRNLMQAAERSSAQYGEKSESLNSREQVAGAGGQSRQDASQYRVERSSSERVVSERTGGQNDRPVVVGGQQGQPGMREHVEKTVVTSGSGQSGVAQGGNASVNMQQKAPDKEKPTAEKSKTVQNSPRGRSLSGDNSDAGALRRVEPNPDGYGPAENASGEEVPRSRGFGAEPHSDDDTLN